MFSRVPHLDDTLQEICQIIRPPTTEVTFELILPLISSHLRALVTENEDLKQRIVETDESRDVLES